MKLGMGYLDNVIVERSTKRDIDSEKNSLHFLDTSRWVLSKSLWDSERIPISSPNINLHQKITSALWSNRGLSVYIGLNDGSVHRVEYFPANKSIDKDIHNVSSGMSRFPDYQPLRGRARWDVEGSIIDGARGINGIIEHGDEHRPAVFDASFAGLFETQSGKVINNCRISSILEYDGKLCMVPLPREFTRESFEMEKAGSLVDVFTGEVLFRNFTPFDGSGYKQADYFINQGQVYLHHGNYPCERITVKEIATGKQVSSVNVLTSNGFVEYDHQVYDMRDCGDRELHLIRSTEKNTYRPAFTVPEGYQFNSMISTKNRGILISLYSQDRNTTAIYSHLEPETPVTQVDGLAELIPA